MRKFRELSGKGRCTMRGMELIGRGAFERHLGLWCGVVALCGALAQPAGAAELTPLAFYGELKAFRLGKEVARVQQLTLKRDRIELTFTGEFYFAEPIAGQVYGAVFLGEGALRVEPWSLFEQ